MNTFKRSRKDGAGKRPAGRARFGVSAGRPRAGGDRQEIAQKFDAVCSNCGKACQVPFRPNGTKPVYCKNCFDAPRAALPAIKRNSSMRPASVGANFGAGAGEGKTIGDLTRQIAAMNVKIDRMLKIIEDGDDSRE